MSQHRINFIGQKKLSHQGADPDFTINASKTNNGTKFNTFINIDNFKDYDQKSKISIEPYVKGGQSLGVYQYGTLDAVKEPANTVIQNFDPNQILFRVKISLNNLIIARADEIGAIISDENEIKNSLFGIREKEMDQIYYIENFPGKKPVIILKKGLNLKINFSNDNLIKGLILPQALRFILSDYLKLKDYEGHDLTKTVLDHYQDFIDKEYPKLTIDEKINQQNYEAIDEWIDDVISNFLIMPVNKSSLIKMFEQAFKNKLNNERGDD